MKKIYLCQKFFFQKMKLNHLFIKNFRINNIFWILTIVLIFNTLFFCACEDILKLNVSGDGNIITDTLRWKSSYNINELELSDNFRLEIYKSQKPFLHIETDSNLMVYIKTEVVRNKLIISRQSDHNLKPSKNIIIRLYINNLSFLTVTNRGNVVCDTLSIKNLSVNIYGKSTFKCNNVYVDNLKCLSEGGAIIEINGDFTQVDLSQTGSGEAYLKGFADLCKFKLTGSGKIEAINLEAVKMNVTLNNSGLIYCNAKDYLSIYLNGNGRVYYRYKGKEEDLFIMVEGEGKAINY